METISDDLLSEYVGRWLQVPIYKEGHLLSPNGRDALCGRPIRHGHGVDELLLLMDRTHEGRIALGDAKRAKHHEWYIKLDTRKGSKCATCKSESKAGNEVRWMAAQGVREVTETAGVLDERPFGWRGRLAALQSDQHAEYAIQLLRKAGLLDESNRDAA